MKKINVILYASLAIFVLMLSSCAKPDKLDFHGIGSMQVKEVSPSHVGIDLGVRMSNLSSHKVKLTEAQFFIYNTFGSKVMEIKLREPAILPRKTYDQEVSIPLSVRFEGVMGMLGMLPALKSGLKGYSFSGELKVKSGLSSKKIEFPLTPFDEYGDFSSGVLQQL